MVAVGLMIRVVWLTAWNINGMLLPIGMDAEGTVKEDTNVGILNS